MHKIDLSKYNLRTDLIIEKNNSNNNVKESNVNGINIKEIDNKENKYITISFKDISDSDNYKKVLNIFINELKKMLDLENITKDKTVLIIGLGNENSTPDSLGTETIGKIIVTRHLYLLNNCDKKYMNVSAFAPNVMGNSGIESKDVIMGIIDRIKPDALIVIDSLCANSINRINKTIQITNSGIHPGSGIGNNREEISKEKIKIPVIALGIPTVVSVSVIVYDTIDYLMKKISYLKHEKKLTDRLKPINKINYQNTNNILSKKEKKDLLGIIGELSEFDMKNLIYEVLSPINENMVVTTTEIDFLIEKLSDLLSEGINKSLHNIN